MLALATAPSPPPSSWKSALAKVHGKTVDISLSYRRGRGAYTERHAATVAIDEGSAAEITQACQVILTRENLKQADFALAVDGRRLPPVRLYADDNIPAEDDRESASDVLVRENIELRAHICKLQEALLQANLALTSARAADLERYAKAMIETQSSRAEEQAERAKAVLAIESKSSQQPASAATGNWWDSETACSVAQTAIEGITSLVGIGVSSVLGGASPPA